jgi:hypothetical protein
MSPLLIHPLSFSLFFCFFPFEGIFVVTIFYTAYDTLAGSPYQSGLRSVEDKLKAAKITGALHQHVFDIKNYGYAVGVSSVEGGSHTADSIPYFGHPVFMKHDEAGAHGVVTTYIDVRNYGKVVLPQNVFVVRNYPEYNWAVLRSVLNHLWITERADLFKDLSTMPAQVYGSLMSEAISRKYALDPGEQLIIMMVSIYFYYCLFTDEVEFDKDHQLKIAGKIAQMTRAPANKVVDILEALPVITGLTHFCEVIKQATGSVRLQDFNHGVLLAIVGGNWYGTNAREILSVGLEHIPTWLMICYASITEATFKKSIIAKLVDRYAKGGTGLSFARSVESLLDAKRVLQEFDPSQHVR